MRWSGESLVFHADASATACAGSFSLQDDYVRRLAQTLQITLDRPIHFSMLGVDELESVCERDTVLGCEFDGDAYSVRPVHLHELAHAVARRGGIHGSEAFREGFAEALGNGFEPKRLRVPIEPVLRDFGYGDEDYYTAALFLRFLIERHGISMVSEFLKRTGKDDSFASVLATFADILGEPLAVAIDAFAEYPSCSAWTNRLALAECGLTARPWVGDAWEAETALDCDDPDVAGPLVDGRSLVWSVQGLVVDTPGQFLARTQSNVDGDSTVRLTRCGSCWDAYDVTVSPGQEKLTLSEGRYFVSFIKELDHPGSIHFSLERVGP